MTKRAILLFSKPATPGRVKTRLIGPLSAEEAARLHEAFLLDLHDRFAGGPVELRIFWGLGPDEALPARPGGGRRQEGAELGERLRRAIEASADCEQVAVVGSDHPELSEASVARAFEALDEGADVVFGPALDGGYYLVGLRPRALRRELFEGIPWSTEKVLAASIARAGSLGLDVALLEPGCDVDRPEDLAPLAARLRREPDLAPRTLAALARLEPSAFGGRQG
ncbi:MAG: TIGR04282 family arsenosugar biosynthesis glycosyltransferase [Acidobacteria bacterium]|nr:TIGR04282 family arsenosugar biosynthesis glycosyltransferase [Acidobacteriota bacterium]MCB9378967.1 TIGR04282 family arsenosugar biosynthesis glycosyltransferase [Holophagales bacterium]